MPYASASASASDSLYDFEGFGNVRLIHITDSHAQLNPVYYREPRINIGIGDAWGAPPHLVGKSFFDYYGIEAGSPSAYAFTYLDFAELAEKYGKLGGYAHLKSLADRLRQSYGRDRTLLLDGGDTWQGSGTSLWTRGMDMVEASNLLGIDVFTGHWEFTYTPEEFRRNIEASNGDFVAQNIFLTEDALFDEKPVHDEFTGHAFPPYAMRTLGGFDIAIIGQAFPYTPIANPRRNVPDWTFGIRSGELQDLIDKIRAEDRPDAVVLLSHNGMDVDKKLASQVSGLDAILGGHTHDAVPQPVRVENDGGSTLVTNAGSSGKFLGVLDLDIGSSGVKEARYRLVPVFSNLIEPDRDMDELIARTREPYADRLAEQLAVSESLLYRRGNFSGSFDQVICDALIEHGGSEIALSPGFRWGTSVLPKHTVTMEDVLSQTAMTYPETYVREMTGETIKLILEDVADNAFNPDPFFQQGGDMVRVGGFTYAIDPLKDFGNRISDIRLDNGDLIEASKIYLVSGWATVGEISPGPPVWDVVADYLRNAGTIEVPRVNEPRLVLNGSNPGVGA